MTSYNPRTDTGFPTEPVGSLPRPMKLQAVIAPSMLALLYPLD